MKDKPQLGFLLAGVSQLILGIINLMLDSKLLGFIFLSTGFTFLTLSFSEKEK